MKRLKRAFEYLLSKGITTVGDFGDIESLVAGADGYAQLWEDFETLERWDAVGDLPDSHHVVHATRGLGKRSIPRRVERWLDARE